VILSGCAGTSRPDSADTHRAATPREIHRRNAVLITYPRPAALVDLRLSRVIAPRQERLGDLPGSAGASRPDSADTHRATTLLAKSAAGARYSLHTRAPSGALLISELGFRAVTADNKDTHRPAFF